MHKRPQCRCRIPTSGNDTGPLPGGGWRSEEARDTGWRHADRRHGSSQDGDTQDADAGTRRRGDANGPTTGKKAANQEDPLPYFVPEFRPLRTLQTKGPVAKTTGPRFNVRCGYSSAATGSSVAAADSHDEQSVHSPAGSAHAAGSETAAGSPAGSSVTARNSASSVWSS